jgi:electron transfer flavoprotein beta subunit
VNCLLTTRISGRSSTRKNVNLKKQHSIIEQEVALKIVVSVKQVPDSAAKVVVEDGQVNWGEAPLVINPWDEYAVEAALLQCEAQGGDVVVVTIGKENSKEALKHALAMGCKEAILISDPALGGLDSLGVAKVLAAAIEVIGDVDAAFFGKQAIDGDMGVTAAQTARKLGWPVLSLVSTIESFDPVGGVRVARATEEGRQIVESGLPAVISVVKDIAEPRYPSFMGIRKASRADIPTWTLADLGIEAPTAAVQWPEVMNPPSREVLNEKIEGDNPGELARTLVDKILAEKVL